MRSLARRGGPARAGRVSVGSRVVEAGVAPPHVEVVAEAAVARLDAAAVAEAALRLALAVLQTTRVPVHAYLTTILISLTAKKRKYQSKLEHNFII